MNTAMVKLPNGEIRMATYRSEFGRDGYVRVMSGPSGARKLVTVSGKIQGGVPPTFKPMGKNAYLVQG